METLLCGSEIDRRLKWSVGRADRLARRGRLPHVRLPDGSIRFEWPAIEGLLVRVGDAAKDADGAKRIIVGHLIADSHGKLMRGDDPRLTKREDSRDA